MPKDAGSGQANKTQGQDDVTHCDGSLYGHFRIHSGILPICHIPVLLWNYHFTRMTVQFHTRTGAAPPEELGEHRVNQIWILTDGNVLSSRPSESVHRKF